MTNHHFLGKEKEMPPATCPNCSAVHDMASPVDDPDAAPKAGDASICIKCGHLSVFTEALTLRDPTDEEIKKYAGDPRIVAAMKAMHEMKVEVKKSVDPNIIYPGKDPDFTFPEETE